MPRSDEANRQVREAQRARILDGARRAFARRGTAATMSDVAAEAEVSQGLAYRYFASKEALIDALAAEATAQQAERLEELMGGAGTPGERLRRLVTAVLEARRDRPEAFQLVERLRTGEGVPPHVDETLRRQGMQFTDLLRRLIVAGQAAGEVAADDPDQLVTAILAYLDGITRMAADTARDAAGREAGGRFPDPAIALRMLDAAPQRKP